MASPIAPTEPGSVLSQAEAVCLAVVATGATHGWAVVRELEPAAELGAVWSLSRQLTYRALEQLMAKGLLTQIGHEPGRGRGRVLLGLTTAGEVAVKQWLDSPALHIRDVRTETLVKLMLRDRLGLDNGAFLRSQQVALHEVIASLQRPSARGASYAELLRREHANATKRFLDTALSRASDSLATAVSSMPSAAPAQRRTNELTAQVTELVRGEALATIVLQLPDGQRLTTVLLDQDADRFTMMAGMSVRVLLTATELVVVPVWQSSADDVEPLVVNQT